MQSAAQLDQLVRQWKLLDESKAEIVVKAAEAMIGWPYVWGASGQDCTPDKRKYFMNRSSIGEGDRELIRKRCQNLSSGKECSGCKYYPGGQRTRIQDCQGFMKELFKLVGITLSGAGCTSMYNNNSLWTAKGLIGDMPGNTVCLVFKYIASTGKMDHVGLHIGNGQIIHCSGEVKRGKTSEKGWTHYAIPKGLEGSAPMSETTNIHPTLRKGSKGEYVMLIQTKLMMLGYDLGKYGADGDFGSKTQEAVKKLQKDSGLTADGIVGPATWAALEAGAVKEELYTVTVPHLHKTDAEALAAQYDGSVITRE